MPFAARLLLVFTTLAAVGCASAKPRAEDPKPAESGLPATVSAREAEPASDGGAPVASFANANEATPATNAPDVSGPAGRYASITPLADFSSGLDQQSALGGLVGNLSPTVSMSVLSAKGGVDSETVASVLEMAREHFLKCGEQTDPKLPPASTSPTTVRFRIGTRGVTSAVSSKGSSKAARECVAALVRKLQFQDSKKATNVSVAITFNDSAIGGYGGLGLSGVGPGGGAPSRGKLPIPQVRVGTPVIVGSMDKNVIRRYIRRKLPQIRYCYERELIAKPKLSGTVTVKFVIEAAGDVASASVTAKGLGHVVSSCVRDAVRTARFPKIPGGGTVTVTYPFAFAPS